MNASHISDRKWCRASTLMAFTLAIFLIPSYVEADEQGFRVGFTSRMFADVNEQDARAAIKVFSSVLAAEFDIPVANEMIIINGDEIVDLFRNKKVDAMGVMTDEFAQLVSEQLIDPIYTISISGQKTERYVLLAHRDASIHSLADLHGKNLLVDGNGRASLAIPWLNIMLAEANLPRVENLVRFVSTENRLGQVVLPVFFRQADVCLVTLSGFETMAELNPQVRKQLVVLAESEDVIPNMFVVRADYQPEFRSELMQALKELHFTTAGRQVLTIFRADTLEIVDLSELEPSINLLRRANGHSR